MTFFTWYQNISVIWISVTTHKCYIHFSHLYYLQHSFSHITYIEHNSLKMYIMWPQIGAKYNEQPYHQRSNNSKMCPYKYIHSPIFHFTWKSTKYKISQYRAACLISLTIGNCKSHSLKTTPSYSLNDDRK